MKLTATLANGDILECEPTGKTVKLEDVPDGALFFHGNSIWEMCGPATDLRNACNLSDLNDTSEPPCGQLVELLRQSGIKRFPRPK